MPVDGIPHIARVLELLREWIVRTNDHLLLTSVKDLKPMPDVVSKWLFATNSMRLLQLLQHVAHHILAVVYLQQFICHGVLAMAISTDRTNHHIRTYEVSYESL